MSKSNERDERSAANRQEFRWKVGDFVGRWISARLGAWIEGETC